MEILILAITYSTVWILPVPCMGCAR